MLIFHKRIKSQSSNRIFAIPHAITHMFRLRSIAYLQISPPPPAGYLMLGSRKRATVSRGDA